MARELVLASSNAGPWHAFHDAEWNQFVIAAVRLKGGYEGVVAELDIWGTDDDTDAPAPHEWERARLFAAAPDLLAALEELTGAYTGGAERASDDPYIMERARAAIAKATGETP